MDERKTKDGNNITNYGNDDTPNSNCHGIVGDGREDLSNDNDVHNGEATSDNNIEDRAELGAVKTERVSRSGNGAETKLSYD